MLEYREVLPSDPWFRGGECRCIGCKVDRDIVLSHLSGEWGGGLWCARPTPSAYVPNLGLQIALAVDIPDLETH